MKTIIVEGVKTLVPEGDENIHEKARRLADIEIAKANIHAHSAHAAILHMRIMRSLLNPNVGISPEVAQIAVAKREREPAHRSSPLSFIPDGEEEGVE